MKLFIINKPGSGFSMERIGTRQTEKQRAIWEGGTGPAWCNGVGSFLNYTCGSVTMQV